MTLLVSGGDVVTMNPARDVLVGGTVAVEGNRVVAVGRTSELRAQFPEAEVLDATGCVVTPGMVNAHQHHTGDPLIKSCIPDMIQSGVWAPCTGTAHEKIDSPGGRSSGTQLRARGSPVVC